MARAFASGMAGLSFLVSDGVELLQHLGAQVNRCG